MQNHIRNSKKETHYISETSLVSELIHQLNDVTNYSDYLVVKRFCESQLTNLGVSSKQYQKFLRWTKRTF